MYTIEGNWDNQCSIVNTATKEKYQAWVKNPYPERAAHMYGMAKFHIQMNYFPKRLHRVVAPTDTRRRPDQRALENGDMKTAAYEKDRLENRQRTFRKYNEAIKKEHEPRYFVKVRNERDNIDYWRYNNLYFEQDRKNQDWSHSPKIFDLEFPEEVLPYLVG